MRMRRWGVRSLLTFAVVAVTFAASVVGASAQLEISSEQMFLIGSEQGPDINVLHLLTIGNPGIEAVNVVELPVPRQATHIVAENVPLESLWLEATRVADQRPMGPGESRNYVLQYELPVRSVPISLQHNMPYPSDQITLWVDASRFRVTGVGPGEGPRGAPAFRGFSDFEGLTFGVYQMEGVPVVDTWQVVIEPLERRAAMKPLGNNLIHGDPSTFFADIRERLTPWLFPWGLLVVAVVVIVFVVRRRQVPSQSGLAGSHAVEELKDAMIDLDMRFRRGELEELAYREMRSNLKAEILSLLERNAQRVGRGGRDEVEVKDGV